MISFGTTYWFVLLIAALLTAAGVTLLFYFKNRQNLELTKGQLRIVMGLRFFSWFLIAFLLLSPFVKSLKKITQEPVIIAAWDNSGSIISSNDSLETAEKVKEIKKLLSEELNADYRVVNYIFGEETEEAGELDFTDKKSDYSGMISAIVNNHFNENIGALIVAGDGIYNEGKNPVNLTGSLNFPAYTLAFGDTTEITDARIQNITVNRTAFSGNRFPAEVDVQFSKLAGTALKLSVLQGENELSETIVTPPNEDYFYSHQFILDAGDPGLKHFMVKIQTAENERNKDNNSSQFVINVLESKQKILILSDGPHPDIGAIRNTLEAQQTYDVTVFTDEPFPSNLSEFNLVILNQLPTTGKSVADLTAKAENNRIPLLYIVGKKTFLPQFNTVAEGAEIEPLAGSMEEAQAGINPAYATFNLSEGFREILPQFPPLLAPFAEYSQEPGFSALLYQKIKNVETAKPLISTGIVNGRKTGYIFGEGLWRWRLFNFYSNQTHSQFSELITQLVQYLALRENEDNFIIDFEPVYDEIENVIFNAEVYNEAFERITSDEINMVITNESGEEYEFTFDVRGEKYRLNAGNLPVGDYTFNAQVEVGDETFTETGSFTVVPVNLENIVTSANHRVLYQLASNSGGNFYLPGSTDQLISDLKNSRNLKPITYFQESVNELLNLRWIFFVLLLLLSMEWFLRKFWGIY